LRVDRIRHGRYDADGVLVAKEIAHVVTSLDAEKASAIFCHSTRDGLEILMAIAAASANAPSSRPSRAETLSS
jgi:hypothetical protein